MKIENRLQKVEKVMLPQIEREEAEANLNEFFQKVMSAPPPLYFLDNGKYKNIFDLSGIKMRDVYRNHVHEKVKLYNGEDLKVMNLERMIEEASNQSDKVNAWDELGKHIRFSETRSKQEALALVKFILALFSISTREKIKKRILERLREKEISH